jgi:hypothetical protein
MKQRYWILLGYLSMVGLAPWITDFFVNLDLRRRQTGSWLLEVLYTMVMKGVWMWGYALFIAILLGMGLYVLRANRQQETFAGFRLAAVLHGVLMLGLCTYAYLAGKAH